MQPPLYEPNTPQFPSDSLAETQKQLLVNFQQLYDVFSVNHVPLDNATSPGNHTKTEILETENGVGIQTNLSEISVFTKNVEKQTDQIFLQYQGNQQEFQYTNYQLYSLKSSTQEGYFTFLPGKILMYFGIVNQSLRTIIDLFPYVSRNILSISLCPVGSVPTNKPDTKILTPREGYIREIELLDSKNIGSKAPTSYYCVMANL